MFAPLLAAHTKQAASRLANLPGSQLLMLGCAAHCVSAAQAPPQCCIPTAGSNRGPRRQPVRARLAVCGHPQRVCDAPRGRQPQYHAQRSAGDASVLWGFTVCALWYLAPEGAPIASATRQRCRHDTLLSARASGGRQHCGRRSLPTLLLCCQTNRTCRSWSRPRSARRRARRMRSCSGTTLRAWHTWSVCNTAGRRRTHRHSSSGHCAARMLQDWLASDAWQ